MKTKNLTTNKIVLTFLFSFVSVALFFILHGLTKLDTELQSKMLSISTADVIGITQNSANTVAHLLKDKQNYVEAIEKDTRLQNKIDALLANLLTENIKYAYLLYKDSNGIFRFLADGSPPQDKALIHQKFDVESPAYAQIYKSKKPVLMHQNLLRQLSITYLHPIMQKENVSLILALDFSIEKTGEINEIIGVVKNILIGIIAVVSAFVVILIFQGIRYLSIKKTAYTDKLTNVYNKNYLLEFEDTFNLQEYILATIDIDYFKKINDTYGHVIGDIILKDVAHTVVSSLRGGDDLVIRFGGEEFIVLIKKQKGGYHESLLIVDRVFKNIQAKKFRVLNDNYLHITVSIGVNLKPEESRNFKDAFKLADKALYRAKENGRNRIEIYP